MANFKHISIDGTIYDVTPATPPSIGNGTLTIQKNGTNVQTFTANQSSNATANITVPTKVSELTNDSGYTTNTGTVTQVKVGTTAYNPSSGVISLPAYPTDTNTHRPIQVNGTEILGNNTTALNLKAGSNVSLSNSSGTVTIAATNTTYSLKEYTSTPANIAAFVQGTANGSLTAYFRFKDTNNVLGFGANVWIRGYIQYQNAYGGSYGVEGRGIVATNANTNVYIVKIDGTGSFTVTRQIIQDTTYSSKAAVSGGTDVSLVTTGEKYTWNQKVSGVKGSSETTYRTGQVNITKANIGLGSVGNFKAVSTAASQGLTATEQLNARTNVGIETLNRVNNNSEFDALLFGTNNADRPLQFCVWGVSLSRLPSNVSYLSGYIYPTVTAGYRVIIGVDFANSNMYFGIAQKDSSNNISILWRKVTAT